MAWGMFALCLHFGSILPGRRGSRAGARCFTMETCTEPLSQAAADALGLLRAEGLEPSPAHEALAARWVAGEIDDEQFELLNLEQVRERLAAAASR